MITGNNEGSLEYKGLSTDTKPTKTTPGRKIKNGALFFEMNTQKLFIYDEENDIWIEIP